MKKPFRTSLWVASTYFAEGLPYVIVLNTAPSPSCESGEQGDCFVARKIDVVRLSV